MNSAMKDTAKLLFWHKGSVLFTKFFWDRTFLLWNIDQLKSVSTLRKGKLQALPRFADDPRFPSTQFNFFLLAFLQ